MVRIIFQGLTATVAESSGFQFDSAKTKAAVASEGFIKGAATTAGQGAGASTGGYIPKHPGYMALLNYQKAWNVCIYYLNII